MPRCIDKEYGGYLNCYENKGVELISKDKYIWSQGRFVWIFSKLSNTTADIFTDEERNIFLEYATHGIEFLQKYSLIDNKLACSYLVDRSGKHLYSNDEIIYDSSIYADFFVIGGFAKYAATTRNIGCFDFAKSLYDSSKYRIGIGDYNVLPFKKPEGRKMHGIPMIRLNIATELYNTAKKLKLDYTVFESDMREYYTDIMENFCDENYVIREIILENNQKTNDLLGRHINPGHSLESIGFILEATSFLEEVKYNDKCYKIITKTLERGWDNEYGGILLYSDIDGGNPIGESDGVSKFEDMIVRLKNYWDSKLYWVHSESLYTLLLSYELTSEKYFLDKYKELHQYSFKTFPNPDTNVGEWIQVRQRDGSPDNRLVGLPVKDPFHITRSLIKIIELLE